MGPDPWEDLLEWACGSAAPEAAPEAACSVPPVCGRVSSKRTDGTDRFCSWWLLWVVPCAGGAGDGELRGLAAATGDEFESSSVGGTLLGGWALTPEGAPCVCGACWLLARTADTETGVAVGSTFVVLWSRSLLECVAAVWGGHGRVVHLRLMLDVNLAPWKEACGCAGGSMRQCEGA